VPQNDSSRIVNEVRAERIVRVSERDHAARTTPADVESAIRIAIKLAVDSGDYERAKALLRLVEGTVR
jgi:hypothetical protein